MKISNPAAALSAPRRFTMQPFVVPLEPSEAADADRFDHEGGVGHYRDALALAQRHGMRPLVAHCHLGLGKIHRRAGKAEDAEHHNAAATAMYRDMDMRFWLAQAQH